MVIVALLRLLQVAIEVEHMADVLPCLFTVDAQDALHALAAMIVIAVMGALAMISRKKVCG